MATAETDRGDIAQSREAFVDRVMSAVLATYDLLSIYVGDRLGLYTALDRRSSTAKELAHETGTDERYVREWLEQQAVTGILQTDDAESLPDDRIYRLSRAHREVLLDKESPNYLAGLARFTAGSLSTMPQLLDAFRTGAGVPYRDFGADGREGQADTNRTQFVNFLGTEWLPAVRDVHERLHADPAAQVADVACGAGWSSIALAHAYPKVQVDGFDLDEASIELARRNAEREGLGHRVAFHVHDASGRSVEIDAGDAGAWRNGDRRRRADGRTLRRTRRRPRTAVLRVERLLLSAHRKRGATLGGDRHGHAPSQVPGVCTNCRLPRRRDPSHRARLLAFLQ